ncbi:MAG: hypothetical protein C4324_09865 [Blastocatellia bacterium]
MRLFNTFRARLLLIFAFLIVATLGVQYYVNLLAQAENNGLRELQGRALVAGISVGISSLTSKDYRVSDLINDPTQTLLDQASRERIRDIIVIDNEWRVTDTLNPEYLPFEGENGEILYKRLFELTDLPPLMEGKRLGSDLEFFPNRNQRGEISTADEAHAIPVETSRGRWYVLVLLKNDKGEIARRAAQPLLATLAILLISTLVTIFLVWRFTRPIAELSRAAQEVAAGNLSISPIPDSRSDEMGTLARNFNEMIAELRKTRELEAKLAQAEKSAVIGRLGSAIAHEIRNPLNYINLTLDYIRSKFAPDESDKRQLFEKLTSQLKGEVARINQQISDFLNYSRPANPEIRPTELLPIIEDSLRLIEVQVGENGIEISIVKIGEIPKIAGDPEFLRSVFNNLFINAVQALGRDGGKIEVAISTQGSDGVRIEVSDNGPGIPPENLDKIFEPYFSTKETGTGLGLAIVQKVIEVHNGSIRATANENGGARFVILLPAAADQLSETN